MLSCLFHLARLPFPSGVKLLFHLWQRQTYQEPSQLAKASKQSALFLNVPLKIGRVGSGGYGWEWWQ